jgi:hypothetical protein
LKGAQPRSISKNFIDGRLQVHFCWFRSLI